jgi:ADP-heptose:LPS heptosyltransferase
MSPDRRFLVLRFSSLGDVVLTTPLLRALRRTYPRAHVTLATKAAYADVIRGNPNVDDVLALKGQGLVDFGRSLRAAQPDDVIDLHRSLRSLALRPLVPARWHRYRKRRWERWRALRRPQHRLPHVAHQYFDAVRYLNVTPDRNGPEVYVSDRDRDAADTVARGHYAVLAPGAARPNKRWPPEAWQDLARRLRAAGVTVVAVGLPHERDLLPPPHAVPCFDRPLRVVAAVCAGASVVVANDSGVMHLAGAVGAPVVAVFGPTHPSMGFAPLARRAAVVQRELTCRPCSTLGGARCPLTHHRCLTEITVADMLRAIEAVA